MHLKLQAKGPRSAVGNKACTSSTGFWMEIRDDLTHCKTGRAHTARHVDRRWPELFFPIFDFLRRGGPYVRQRLRIHTNREAVVFFRVQLRCWGSDSSKAQGEKWILGAAVSQDGLPPTLVCRWRGARSVLHTDGGLNACA